MSEFTPDQRARGLALANRLTDLAAEAPDIFAESKLHATAHVFRQRYGYSRELKKASIVKRVHQQPMTMSELQADLGYNLPDLSVLVRELADEGKVAINKAAPAGSRGGRPVQLISVLVRS